MKLLLVAESEELKKGLVFHLRPIGVEVIHYMNPLKAMDNIDEVDPEAVLFSCLDYPRHWKPFLQLLRGQRARNESIFVLLRGNEFSVQEAAKAVHLQVNGIVLGNGTAEGIFHQLEEILVRYSLVTDGRRSKRYMPTEFDELEFVMTHPATLQVVAGILSDISLTGARFSPDDPTLTEHIERGTEVPTCSLQVGDDILTLACRVVRNNRYLGLQFISMSDEAMGILKSYLDNRAERQLKAHRKRTAAGR